MSLPEEYMNQLTLIIIETLDWEVEGGALKSHLLWFKFELFLNNVVGEEPYLFRKVVKADHEDG